MDLLLQKQSVRTTGTTNNSDACCQAEHQLLLHPNYEKSARRYSSFGIRQTILLLILGGVPMCLMSSTTAGSASTEHQPTTLSKIVAAATKRIQAESPHDQDRSNAEFPRSLPLDWSPSVVGDVHHHHNTSSLSFQGGVLPLVHWTLSSNDNQTLPVRVPGDIVTDLLSHHLIDNPYQDRNFLTQRQVWMGDSCEWQEINDQNGTDSSCAWQRVWTYTTTINSMTLPSKKWLLVLEGVKMGARVLWNGKELTTIRDQFVRTILPLPADEKNTNHTLQVVFDPTISVDGRFMACSGGWDWAPYAQEVDVQGKRRWTAGLVRPVYVVPCDEYAVTQVVPHIRYRGVYPTHPMTSHPEDDFDVQLDVHLWYQASHSSNSATTTSLLHVSSPTLFGTTTFTKSIFSPLHQEQNDDDKGMQIRYLSANEMVVTLHSRVAKETIDLWWPNGMGPQPLYNITVAMSRSSSKAHAASMAQAADVTPSSLWIQNVTKRVGFRTVALVTRNETAAAPTTDDEENQSGSGRHGMYFRVNGAVVVARGANFIPMDQLEGRLSDDAHRKAVQSAAQANMNMLRVWGGGMVLPNAFYDMCDEVGILLYHDLMFVDEAGHRPVQSDVVDREIRHIVRSLSSHPSLVLWNACNECEVIMGTPTAIYATFVMQVVADEDNTRCIWPSSPSRLGWKTGVDPVWGLPDGTPLSTWDKEEYNETVIESHGPYMRSFSKTFPGVNGQDVGFPYANTPPTFSNSQIGVEFSNSFSSEFGASVMSSFESMSGTLNETYWSLHGGATADSCIQNYGNENNCTGNNTLAERNYPCDSHIEAYFGLGVSLGKAGALPFQEQLYYCLISQALWMKGEIEKRRAQNSFGMLIWQLNENWPTGGWGVIEYGGDDDTGSQISGGRWKPLMHLLHSSLFTDVVIACGHKDMANKTTTSCYLRNDSIRRMKVKYDVEAWSFAHNQPSSVTTKEISLNPGTIYWFTLPDETLASNDILIMTVRDSDHDDKIVTTNSYLWTMPKDMEGLSKPSDIKIADIELQEDGSAMVAIQSSRLALFVVLTTREEGRFSENAFHLRPRQSKTIVFKGLAKDTAPKVNVTKLQATIRVEHLGYYQTKKELILEGRSPLRAKEIGRP